MEWIGDYLIPELHRYFAASIKQARERQGLSRLALAERAGLSQQMVSYLERGIRKPSLDTLVRVCEVLQIHFPALAAEAWEKSLRDKRANAALRKPVRRERRSE